MQIGYKLCSEEQSPQQLLECAQRAEETGFSFATISDHFHPWIDRQGQSSFVWTVLGGIGQVTERMRIGTAVTCPTMRVTGDHSPSGRHHGRHVAGSLHPRSRRGRKPQRAYFRRSLAGSRCAPLKCSRKRWTSIRLLWQGGQPSHYARYYTLENARIYTLPDSLPPIMMAASGPKAAELAGLVADGLIATSPDKDVVENLNAPAARESLVTLR